MDYLVLAYVLIGLGLLLMLAELFIPVTGGVFWMKVNTSVGLGVKPLARETLRLPAKDTEPATAIWSY